VTAAPVGEPRPFAIPWTALAASLVAIASLFVTSGWAPFAPILAAAIIASRFVPRRFGATPGEYLPLLVGGVAVVLVSIIVWPPPESDGLLMPRNATLIGGLSAAVLAAECWMRRPHAGAVSVMGLSMLTLWASMNTFSEGSAPILAPAYVVLITIAARSLGRHTEPGLPSRMPAAYWTVGAGLLALGFGTGFAVYYSLHRYRAEVTSWAMDFLHESGASRYLGQTGLSRRPSLGAGYGLEGSLDRVLRIEGSGDFSHLRAAAFTDYSRGDWSPAIGGRPFVPADPRTPATAQRKAGTLRITTLGDVDGLLFAPLNAAGVDPATNVGAEWSPSEGGPLRVPLDPPEPYLVSVDAEAFHQGPLCVPPGPAELKRLLEVPRSVDPRVHALARKITEGAASQISKAEAVVAHLQATHRYSLSFGPGNGDPVSRFVLGREAAHCEYFGSATAILLRCAGVPARYVIGYYAHEQRDANTTIVRQRDAHAWAEAWIEGVGWVTLDATPADGRPDQSGQAVPFWRRLWERLQDWWSGLLARLGLSGPSALLAVLGALAVVAGLAYLRRRGRRGVAGERPFEYSAPPPQLSDARARFEAWYARGGVALPPHHTWLEAARLGMLGSAAEDFVRTYNLARFGTGDAAALAAMRAALDRLEAARTWHRKEETDGRE